MRAPYSGRFEQKLKMALLCCFKGDVCTFAFVHLYFVAAIVYASDQCLQESVVSQTSVSINVFLFLSAQAPIYKHTSCPNTPDLSMRSLRLCHLSPPCTCVESYHINFLISCSSMREQRSNICKGCMKRPYKTIRRLIF